MIPESWVEEDIDIHVPSRAESVILSAPNSNASVHSPLATVVEYSTNISI